MSVEQLSDYYKAFRFSVKEDIKGNEEIQEDRGTFFCSKREWYYVKDKKRMQELAHQGNIYAKGDIDDNNK